MQEDKDKSEYGYLFIYTYKGDVRMTLYYQDDKTDVFQLFNVLNGLIVKDIPFMEKALRKLIMRLSSETTPELGLHREKMSKHFKLCDDRNKIDIDENEHHICVRFRDTVVTYTLSGYHEDYIN